VAAEKVIPIAAAAQFREILTSYTDAGWSVDGAHFHVDVAGGAALYLCDMEAGQLLLVTLRRGALEQFAEKVRAVGVSFEEACNCLGSLFTELVHGRLALAGATKNDLAIAAGIYIVGTQSYAVGMPKMRLPQFLVIRHPDREVGGHMLRPVPLIKETPMSPDELVHVVNETLARDRARHPARFGRGQVLPFTLKSKA
jgi:hypothetical protein